MLYMIWKGSDTMSLCLSYEISRELIYEFWEAMSQDVMCIKRSGWKNMHSIVVPGFNIL